MNLKRLYNIPATIINKIIFFMHKTVVAKKVQINGILRLYGKGRVFIGEGTRINSRYRNNPIGGQRFTSLYAKANATIEIGKYTGLSNCSIYSSLCVKIGDYVKIGGNVKIYDTDFHSLSASDRRNKNDDSFSRKAVIIEDDVFVGAGCIILKGVTIGKGAVIGAGSVVTKSIPEWELWAGNPAVFIRKLKI